MLPVLLPMLAFVMYFPALTSDKLPCGVSLVKFSLLVLLFALDVVVDDDVLSVTAFRSSVRLLLDFVVMLPPLVSVKLSVRVSVPVVLVDDDAVSVRLSVRVSLFVPLLVPSYCLVRLLLYNGLIISADALYRLLYCGFIYVSFVFMVSCQSPYVSNAISSI